MKTNISKDKLAKIETAFNILRETQCVSSLECLDVIKNAMEEMFPEITFNISITQNFQGDRNNKTMFVMSVCPEISTISKIIDAVMSDKDTEAISKLWSSNKVWTIDIDRRILDDRIIDFTDRELTSLLLHEIGHIVVTNSIPSRISLILRYEIAKANFNSRALMKSSIFKNILSLPIFDSCIADNKKTQSSIKEEIKADNFVKKVGYSKDLYSALTKLSTNKLYKNDSDINSKMKNVFKFSKETLEDFQARKDNIAKKKLLVLKEHTESEYISKVLDDYITTIFEDGENMYEGQKLKFMHEQADKIIEDEVYQEFFLFKKKTLKKINSYEFDYIEQKISEIKDETDRMLIISYINGKRDLVEYYLAILLNPEIKKYNIPHTEEQLREFKRKLDMYMEKAMKQKTPFANHVTYVSWPGGPSRKLYTPDIDWPEGYEG